jgi:FKBP-type peptidyl-prolyl cis-trans isomerase (trigger factor)
VCSYSRGRIVTAHELEISNPDPELETGLLGMKVGREVVIVTHHDRDPGDDSNGRHS